MFVPLCAKRTRRLIHFFVCAKCKCDRYARFCLAKQMCLQQMCVCGVYLFMWPALCPADAAAVNRTLTSHRDATATFCFSSLFQQIVSLFLVAYRCYRFASHVSFVCCFLLKPDAFSLTHTHTQTLFLFFPLSTQRRFELEIFVCSFSFVRLFSYSPFCCVPSSSTCFVVLHIRQAGGE